VQGYSAIDIAGNPFYDADADAAPAGGVRANRRHMSKFKNSISHINDDAFADACCRQTSFNFSIS